MIGRRDHGTGASGLRRGAAGHPVGAMLALPLLLFLGVPVAMLVVRGSTGAVWESLRDRETLSAIGVSLWTSGAALVVSVVLGTPLAYWLARERGGAGARWRAIVETVVDLPTVLPPSVAGIALLLTLGRNGVVGAWLEGMGVGLAFTGAAVVAAQVFVSAPYFVRAARAGFESVDRDLREAAMMDGATGWGLVRRVMLPLSAPSLAAGAAMCWGRAVGEFGATIIFAGNLPGRTQTMPLAVYVGLEMGLDRALALSVILIGMAVVVLVGVRSTRRGG